MRRLLAIFLAVTGCAHGQLVDAGDEAAKQGDWEAAYKNYNRAVAEDDEKEAVEKRDAAHYQWLMRQANEARADASRSDTLGAIVAARKAWDIWPEHAEAIKVVNEISEHVCAHATKLMGQRDYANAVMLHDAAIRELVLVRSKHQNEIRSIKTLWHAQLEQVASAAEQAGRTADAMLVWSKMAQLSDDVEDHRRAKVLREKVHDELAYLVSVAGTSRDDQTIAAALDGFQRGTLRVSSGVEVAAASVSISFDGFDVRDQTSQKTAAVEYRDGVKQVPNPSYDNRMRDVQAQERRLADAENEVNRLENRVLQYEQAVAREADSPNTSTGAEQNLYYARNDLTRARDKVITERNNLIRAKDTLSREPQFRDEPVYRTWTFPVRTVTRTATANVTIQLVHENDGQKVVRRVDASMSDETHDAQPTPGLAADPLTLPSESEFHDMLIDNATETVRGVIIADFSKWRASRLVSAMQEQDPDQRVEALVRYVVTDPNDADISAVTAIAAARNIPDVIGVLTAP